MRNTRFWILMGIFQVAFGLAVFGLTRQYYLATAPQANGGPVVTNPHAAGWPDQAMQDDPTGFNPPLSGPATVDDLAALSRRADDAFEAQQYDQAAALYRQILDSGVNDVVIFNNLGITLHYLGRHSEALEVLGQGIAADPTYPRIWLTQGFVNSQLGNIEAARDSLEAAVRLGAGDSVGESAVKMLENLPPP